MEWLPWVELSYNTLVNTDTRMTPFEAVYGRPPPTVTTYMSGTSKMEAIDSYLQGPDVIL